MESIDWAGIYKFGRLAALALILCGIGAYLYVRRDGDRFEEPARRMLEDEA